MFIKRFGFRRNRMDKQTANAKDSTRLHRPRNSILQQSNSQSPALP